MTATNLPEPADRDLMALSWAGVDACTLPTTERPLRLAVFEGLFASSLRSIERVEVTHARLLLQADPNLAGRDVTELATRVQALADAESACCSFFTFTVTALDGIEQPGSVHLDVRVPPAYASALDGLLDLARASARLDAGEDA